MWSTLELQTQQPDDFAGTAQGAGQMQERAVPVSSAVTGRVRAEDVLAHVEGGLDEMSDEEVLENTVLAESHEELLKSHGYRLVRVTLPCAFVAAASGLLSVISPTRPCTGCVQQNVVTFGAWSGRHTGLQT